MRAQLRRPAFSRVADPEVRYLPYGELERNREAMARFGSGSQGRGGDNGSVELSEFPPQLPHPKPRRDLAHHGRRGAPSESSFRPTPGYYY